MGTAGFMPFGGSASGGVVFHSEWRRTRAFFPALLSPAFHYEEEGVGWGRATR